MNPISMGPKLYRLQPVGTSAGNTISRKWYCKTASQQQGETSSSKELLIKWKHNFINFIVF
ncbi:hypothetical protein FOCC_FOCC014248 [Frankliniella occidentalis]|nr:hypothetical protein FOCC_FOCC014248 [Frankliniella occidentalis]